MQSYRQTMVASWIDACMASVRQWSQAAGFDYHFVGDEIFDLVPDWYRQKAGRYKQISTDLGRLALARNLLDDGYQRVIWLDADVLVFDPARFQVNVHEGCAFGREVWVQQSADGQLKAYRNVHNAFCCFCRDNSFLDFYMEACRRILKRSDGGLPPQIVGTKMLTALHNMIGFDLVHTVGMASPLILADIVNGTSQALKLLREKTEGPLCAANLCGSLSETETDGVALDEVVMATAVTKLLKTKGGSFNL